MSYKALYRKYRPNTFDDVLGQDQIITTLKNIITSNKISHAYLFAGPRGTGKTSVAHVFAREINKSASGRTTLNPLDVIEIDAASNNGVAEVRNLIEASKYAPHEEKFKVYIIDEVHMLTKGAFNALLKTLEEPPAHVIFILATTEPDKLPVTILSRLQRFNFKQIENKIIESQLKNVLSKENVIFDEKSIKLIASIAQGGMRDALSIADQASAYGNNQISFETISKAFGLISIENQIKMLNHADKGNAKELLTMVDIIINNGADLERLTSSLINIIRDFIVFRKTKAETLLRYLDETQVNSLELSETSAYRDADVLTELITNLKTTMLPRQIFELAMLKLINKNKTKKVETIVVEEKQESKPEDTAVFKTDEIFVEEDISENQENLTEEMVESAKVEGDPTNVDLNFNIEENAQEEIMNTDEINLTAEMALAEQEVEEENASVSNEILNTQEINLAKPEETSNTEEEIDLVSMFNTHTEDIRVIQDDTSPKADEIINLLVQADKAAAAVAKEKIITAPSLAGNQLYGSYISLFDSLRVIAKGTNFVLLSSKSDDVVKQIRADKGRQSLIDFAKDLFGEPTWIYAITVEEFEEVKDRYKELAASGNLPTPKIIEKPKITEKRKTEEEEYGSDLFGSLFK